MTIAIYALIAIAAILAIRLGAVSRKLLQVNERLVALEEESLGRLDIIDDQISEIGGAVMVLQRLVFGKQNQGIRALNHDYNGEPFDHFMTSGLTIFRRSGDMYLSNPDLLPTDFTDKDDFPNVPEDHLQPLEERKVEDIKPYIGDPQAPVNPVKLTGAWTNGTHGELAQPIVPQPLADGEPYQNFDAEEADADRH